MKEGGKVGRTVGGCGLRVEGRWAGRKERKGEERKGKERKGKEGIGKERKGKGEAGEGGGRGGSFIRLSRLPGGPGRGVV